LKNADILIYREKRYKKIQKLKTRFNAVITVKTNIPGDNKNHHLAYFLTNFFFNHIPSELYEETMCFESIDGPYFLLGSYHSPITLKRALIALEDQTKLGRFIDLDVFDGNQFLSRGKLRPCFICDEPAFVCGRKHSHSVEELLNFMETSVEEYLVEETKNIILYAIKSELDLHPKFGLVTPFTNGSHEDMNYNLMNQAKDVITPFLIQMFRAGYSSSNLKKIFSDVRQIGMKAEQEMYESTGNINAYKGLIFNLGIIVTSFGYMLYNNKRIKDLYEIAKQLVAPVQNDFEGDINSFGMEAYDKYQILGVRGEALKGFQSVQSALSYLSDYSDESKLDTLMYLISIVDDTVLLKRTGSYERYLKIKEIFKKHIHSNRANILSLDHYCIENNLSFGGSADLLVLTIFIKRVSEIYG